MQTQHPLERSSREPTREVPVFGTLRFMHYIARLRVLQEPMPSTPRGPALDLILTGLGLRLVVQGKADDIDCAIRGARPSRGFTRGVRIARLTPRPPRLWAARLRTVDVSARRA